MGLKDVEYKTACLSIGRLVHGQTLNSRACSKITGISAVVARTVRDREAGSSNLPSPTEQKYFLMGVYMFSWLTL